jgi:hypothetical protein
MTAWRQAIELSIGDKDLASDQLGEVRERAGQTVDLVDHDDIDPAVADVCQQPLQGGALGRAAGIAAVVVTGADQGLRIEASAASCWVDCRNTPTDARVWLPLCAN